MENSGSTERKRNNYIISRSGKFKSKNKKRIQITDEFWIDPVQSPKLPQQQQQQPSSNQDVYREITTATRENDPTSTSIMKMFQNFTTSNSSHANNFIRSDKKLLSDKQPAS